MGGRLDYLNRRPVAVTVYRHRQDTIDLYVWPAAEAYNSSIRTFSKQGYNIVHSTRDGMTFWAISDVALADLAEFARLVINASGAGLKNS